MNVGVKDRCLDEVIQRRSRGLQNSAQVQQHLLGLLSHPLAKRAGLAIDTNRARAENEPVRDDRLTVATKRRRGVLCRDAVSVRPIFLSQRQEV
jgi:hypothetical protein